MATVIFKQGDSINEVITIFEADGTTVVDITGGTIKFRIVTLKTDLKAAAIFNDDDVTITDATNGQATLTIARSITKVWTIGNYFWEVEYIDSATNFSHTDSDALVISNSIYTADS